jgi:hypothetical protein
MLTVPLPLTVHTNGVDPVYVTAIPEDAVAPNAKFAAVESTAATVGKVIVCKRRDTNDRVTLVAAL